MNPFQSPVRFAAAAICAAALGAFAFDAAIAQDKAPEKKKTETPIPYVPSPQSVVDRMLELAGIEEDDVVLDLGSGDGRIPITAAARFGARGLGVDIDEKLVELATKNAEAAGVADRVTFRKQDLFDTELSQASVVSLYLPTAVNVKLRPRLLDELRPGSRIIAHQFALGDWDADIRETLNHRFIYLWIVPAKVEGTWRVTAGDETFDLHLSQTFQKLLATASRKAEGAPPATGGTAGTLLNPGADSTSPGGVVLSPRRYLSVNDILLRGDEIDFSVSMGNGRTLAFRGRVDGERMASRAEDGEGVREWQAERISDKTRPEGGNDDYWWQPLQ